MELDPQSLFGLLYKAVPVGWGPLFPPHPRVWAHIRGRYWSAKIDNSLWPPGGSETRIGEWLIDYCFLLLGRDHAGESEGVGPGVHEADAALQVLGEDAHRGDEEDPRLPQGILPGSNVNDTKTEAQTFRYRS